MTKQDKILAKLNLLMMETASIDTLFHNTSPNKALSILKDGAFRLPLSETNASETRGQKVPALFYLSTARTITSGYISDRGPHLNKLNDSVVFVIDTKKLRQKNRGIKIVPFEYWGNADASGRRMGAAREAEERIYSDNRTLKIKGCVKVLLAVRDDKYANNFHLRNVYSYCLKNKIPVKLFTYDNLAGFKLQREKPEDKNRALQLLKEAKREHPYQTSHKGVSPHSSKTSIKFYAKKGDGIRLSDLQMLRALVDKTEYSQLPYKVKTQFFDYNGMYARSVNEYFSNYLHNLRGSIAHGSDEIDKLHDLIRKMRAKTVNEFFEKLIAKWSKLYEDHYRQQQREQEEKRQALAEAAKVE